MNDLKFPACIKITNFPSRNEVLNFFKSFISNSNISDNYNIINKSNEITIILYNHDIAYKFTETFNKKINENPLYSNTECTLTFKKLAKSSSCPSINKKKYNFSAKQKILLRPKKNTYKKYSVNKSASFVGDYERIHWAHIRDRACIIDNDSPYIDNQSKEYREKLINQRKWINKKNFNIFIGKASSNLNNMTSEIKNYVGMTPSLPPVLYQFRSPQKNKWIVNSGFHLY